MNLLNLWRPRQPATAAPITAPVRPPCTLKPARSKTTLTPPKPLTVRREVEPRFKRARPRPARDLIERFEHELPVVGMTRRERRAAAERAARIYGMSAPDMGDDLALRAIRSDWRFLQEDIAEQMAMGDFDDRRDDMDEQNFFVPVIDEGWSPEYDRDTWAP